MKNNNLLLLFILAGLCFAGCKTLKAVNNLSTAASSSLQEFDQFEVSITGIYADDLRQRTLGNYSDTAIVLRTDTLPTTNFFPMSLAVAKQKDTALRKIYTALHGYFSALAKLSADSLVDYSLDTVTNYLSAGSIIDTTQISPGTITAIGSIAAKLGEFISNGYRLKHIRQYVVESDAVVQRLIGDLKSSVRIERNLLMIEQEYLRDPVFKSLVRASRSSFERKQVADQFYRVMADLTNRQLRLDNYMLSLDVIETGHAYIRAHVDDLRSDKVRMALTKYVGRLKDRQSEFNALTHSSHQ